MKAINKEKLRNLISREKWKEIITEFNFNDICLVLGYKSSMNLAYDLFFKNPCDNEIQGSAIQLFMIINKTYLTEWNRDWKNDAFLGKLCSLTWKYDEMYEYYKKAYDKLIDPPDSLLLLLASCNSAPGAPPLSDQEAIEYLKRAIAKKMTYEAALMMRSLARDTGNATEEEYWDQMCQELDKNNIHVETIIPDIFSN